MVGNDIVDLQAAGHTSNWHRERFLDKLFTPSEQHHIREAECPFPMLWRLWSLKEASYKLYTQLYPGRFYNPKGFECSLYGQSATVEFKGFQCYAHTRSTSDYIISEASLNKKEMGSVIVKLTTTDPKGQSEELRDWVLQHLGGAYRFQKNPFDIPVLVHGKEQVPISLTHHGRYGAFALV